MRQSEFCGHTIVRDGIEEPCDRPAFGWRWYQDVPHEDCLEPACTIHENVGGNRLHRAESEVARVRELVTAWSQEGLGRTIPGTNWEDFWDDLIAVLEGR